MESSDIGTIVGVVLVATAFFFGLYYLSHGISLFGSADYLKDPLTAFRNQTTGVLETGVGGVLVLVALGAGTTVIVAFLKFVSKAADGR